MRYAIALLVVLAAPASGQAVVSVREFRGASTDAQTWYLAGFIDAAPDSVPWACVEEWRHELVDAVLAYTTLYVDDFGAPAASVIPDALATACHQFITEPPTNPAPPTPSHGR